MGRCLEVYSIEAAKLEGAIGGQDEQLRRMICGRFRQDIQRANDWAGWSNERGAPSIFEAIRDLIMADEQDIAQKRVYDYAYKFITRFFGEGLNNSHFCPHHGDYLEEVQARLRGFGASLSMWTLTYGGALPGLNLPKAHFAETGYGYVPSEIITSDEEILRAVDLQDAAIAQVYGWLSHAKRSGHVLVGFFTI